MSGIYWLASYPKSGNTWLRVLLTNYLKEASQPVAINELTAGNAAGFLQSSFDEFAGIDSSDLTESQTNYYRPRVYEKMAAESSETLFLKIHDAFVRNAEGNPIFSPAATAGAIYIVRNPLDVAVSYAHHENESTDKIIKHMNRSDAYLANRRNARGQLAQKLKSWSEHAFSWADAAEINVHLVRYEDLLREPAAIFAGVVRFARLPFDAERIEKAVEFSRFERLREQEQTGGFSEKQTTAASFFRKGTAGSWRERLTGAQVEQIIRDHRQAMRRFGYLTDEDQIKLC